MTERFYIAMPIAAGEGEYAFSGTVEKLPTYQEADGAVLYWANRDGMPLPKTGDKVVITMNHIGPAVVVGYFASERFLGVMTRALEPPVWLKRQNRKSEADATKPDWYRRGIGCEFGGEIRPYKRGDMAKHRAALKEINKRWAA